MSTSDELRPNWLTTPHPKRFGPQVPGFRAAMAAHEEALQTGQAGYLDPPSGLFVMTSRYLRDRGHCCDCQCRHCPYNLS